VSPKPRQSLPPIIRTSDPGSFAAFTLPEMLERIISKNGLSRGEAAQLEQLKKRLHSGTIRPDLSDHPYLAVQMDEQEYRTWSGELEQHAGRSWLDLPWYFAESLFYLEVLLAWGYAREDHPRFGVDPYQIFKEEELKRSGGGPDLGTRIAAQTAAIESPEEILALLLRYSLWANRLDLSYSQLLERYADAPQGEANQLLLDHSETITEKLLRARRVDLILDNSASELVSDLYLAHQLLQFSPGLKVVLHCKKSPYYVSDAMIKDVESTVSIMEQNREQGLRDAGRALRKKIEGGSLVLEDHWFWNGPLFFHQLPFELDRELGTSDLVVLKGDLNYRRLLLDRKWDPATPMEEIVGYFPAALATLRTTKSELIVDCPRKTFAKLSADDPKWLVEGRYGIIRYCDPSCPSGSRSSTTPLAL
jgi:uncharacterized protein with ATP-grasp and redox domains